MSVTFPPAGLWTRRGFGSGVGRRPRRTEPARLGAWRSGV